MTDLRETFEGARPETSDVVLCLHCGETLHAPENDVFWKETADHCCPKMQRKAVLQESLDAIANLPTGKSEDVMEGQEQAYRAIEGLMNKDAST